MSDTGAGSGTTEVDEDAEILQEFLVESHENLDQVDRDLVELEQRPDARDLLSSIFRSIHTIKGTSGFLALGRLERLTHLGENLLSELRDGRREMSESTAGALLQMVDTVRALLELIETSGGDEGPVDVETVTAELERVLSGDEPATESDAVSPEPVDQAAPEPVLQAAAEPAPPAAPPPVVPAEATPEPESVIEPEAESEPQAEAAPVAAVSPEAAAPLEQVARTSAIDATVRVDVGLLDMLVQMVGELVLSRNQILQRAERLDDIELARATHRLNLIVSELQEGVMKTRMQPIGQVWSKMPRVVRDLGHQLNRKINLVLEGHDTELDRTLLEAVRDPLTHLVRNAVDHGLEPPEERVAAGKPAEGHLGLRAYHESGQVVVEIADDGRGIDAAKIGSIAVSRGLITPDQLAGMDTRELTALIFRPGFSTASAVTNVSGRGVGMDVVRTNIERIGGSVDINSTFGHGTTVRVRIPLTLAIIPALLIGERGETYALPQSSLVELVRLDPGDLARDREVLAGAPVLRLRGRLLPLVHLSDVLGLPTLRSEDESITVVVLQADGLRFGLVVDEVDDTQEIVVKPVGRQLKGLPYAGATVLGDGRVALILDVATLAADAGVTAVTAVTTVVEDVAGGDLSSVLLLEVSAGRRAALPLDSVARLEEIPCARIELSGSREVIQYRDGILPLVHLAQIIGLPSSTSAVGPDGSERSAALSVVVHERGDSSVGIVIDRVLDVVETRLTPSIAGRRPGVTGSAVVQDQVTDLVDLDAVLELAGMGQ